MLIEKTLLSGVVVITPARIGDHRGFFSESYNRAKLVEHGINLEFVQDNHSLSDAVGTVRGLHFQAPPKAQDKLMFVLARPLTGSPSGLNSALRMANSSSCQRVSPTALSHVNRGPRLSINALRITPPPLRGLCVGTIPHWASIGELTTQTPCCRTKTKSPRCSLT
jgi:hypothetical protein